MIPPTRDEWPALVTLLLLAAGAAWLARRLW